MTWLGHLLGLDDVSGAWYAWWSGAGGDLQELAIIGGVLAFIRHRNCHMHGCWRLGRHAVEGTEHVVCRKHHPDGPLRPHHLRP